MCVCVCSVHIHVSVCVLCIHVSVCSMHTRVCSVHTHVCSMHTCVHTCGVPFMHRDRKRRLGALTYHSIPDSSETASFTEPGAHPLSRLAKK